MRNRISRTLCFIFLLNVLFGGGLWATPAFADDSGSSSVTDSTYDPVTILDKDFSQAIEGQSASQLGFDYSTLTTGTGKAVVEVDPVSNKKALHLNVAGAVSGSISQEFTISKTFSETQQGTISTEITFMQPGTAKLKDRILLFTPPGGGLTNLINVGLDASKGVVYFPDTAPTNLSTPFNLNQWYTMRVELNTVTRKFSIWLNGTCIVARAGTNAVQDLKKIQIATPAGNGDLYIGSIKVTRTPFNPVPKAPVISTVVGRNTKIAYWTEAYTWATKYRTRIREKGQTNWLPINSTVNYSDYTSVSNIVPSPSIGSYYDTTQGKTVPLTNGKTYIVGVSVVTSDVVNKVDYEGKDVEFEATPNQVTPIQTPGTSVIGTVTAYANYNANLWSINSGVNVGDLVFADKTVKFTAIPTQYAGMDWVRMTQADTMTYPNAADGVVQSQVADFRVRDKSTVYVAVDQRETTLPTFLSGWTDTGDAIQMSDTAIGYSFKIYKKVYNSGDLVTLGYNNYVDYKAGKNIGYFVMAQRTPIGLALDPVKQWVNTASYSVTGSVYEDVYSSSVTLTVYQNQNPVPVYSGQLTKSNFQVDLNLAPGANLIEMYAKRNNSTSSDKVTATVNYDNVIPEISISAPPVTVKDAVYTLQGSLSKTANLTVKLNGVKIADSVTKAAYETFSYPLTFAEGVNSIEVSAVDLAGNVNAVNYLINYVFWAGQAATYDLRGNSLNALTASKDIIAQRQVTNSTATAKQLTLWFVLYDANNTMLQYSGVIADFDPGETKTLSTGFTLPAQVTGYYVKAFIWDSLNGMKPLSDEFRLQ